VRFVKELVLMSFRISLIEAVDNRRLARMMPDVGVGLYNLV
jgi:hypothetical protein